MELDGQIPTLVKLAGTVAAIVAVTVLAITVTPATIAATGVVVAVSVIGTAIGGAIGIFNWNDRIYCFK